MTPFVIAALMAVLCVPAQAVGERNVFKYTVLSSFTDGDSKLMKARRPACARR